MVSYFGFASLQVVSAAAIFYMFCCCNGAVVNPCQCCHPENLQQLCLYPLCDQTTPLLRFFFLSSSICRCLSVDVVIDVLDVGCLIFQALLRRAAALQPVGRLDFYEYLMLSFFIPSLLKPQLQNSNIDAHTDTHAQKYLLLHRGRPGRAPARSTYTVHN